jgi:urate oxidase
MTNQDRTMYYGKGDVFVFRTYATPLTGLKVIPESSFTNKKNVIFGMNAKIALKGKAFLSSFTEGDNSLVIATDSMKNFMLRHAAQYKGSTLEGFLIFVCERFLETYSHIDAVRISANEVPFDEVPVSNDSGTGIEISDVVYRNSRNEYATATVEVERTETGSQIIEQHSGVHKIQLIKVKGSSFYGYIHDEYTTLPEATDRPLFIYLDINWKYENKVDALGANPEVYVAAEQVRDIAASIFHHLENKSIQQLIYHIGLRVLDRFPQLSEINFETNNRTWEMIVEEIPNSEGSVFTEPRPPFGFQGFAVTREDLAREKANAESAYVSQ